MSNQAKNQHYISGFLLRKFEINPESLKKNRKVFLLHKQTKKIEKEKIANICAVDFYNALPQNEKLDRMEDKFTSSLQKYLDKEHDKDDIRHYND